MIFERTCEQQVIYWVNNTTVTIFSFFQTPLPARERAIVDDRIFAVTRANHIYENHWNQLFSSIIF